MDEKLNNELEALKNELIELKSKSPINEKSIRLQLDKVGEKCYDLGKYEEALSYFNESLEIGKRILPPNHYSIARTNNNIGEVYKDKGKYEEAMRYYNESLKIYKQTLPSNHPSIADTLNNIGIVYKNQGKYEEALKYYNQSLEIKKQKLPSNHYSIASTLNNIGVVYFNQEKSEEALKYLSQSLEIYKQTLPSKHSSIASTLNNIGTLYDDQGNYVEALKYYNESLEIYKQTLPSNHFSIANTLNNIGFLYYNQGKYEEAMRYYKQSLEMKKQTLPSNHQSITSTLSNIGTLYDDQGNYEEALKYYNQSLEIYKRTLPSNHSSIASTLNNIGLVYEKQGKYEEALKYYNESLKIYKQILPPNHPSIAIIFNNIEEVRYQGNISGDISQLSLSSTSKSENNQNIEDPYIDKIFKDRYKVRVKLGSGSFGLVYLVKDINLKEEDMKYRNLAMKIMNKCDSETENELKIFWEINHENIVKYIDHFDMKIGTDEKTCLLTEYCEKGDLKCHIEETKKGLLNFSEKDILKWMCQATNALKYLHYMEPKPIIHRDIKPANMLLNKKMQIKIADLGVSKILDMDRTSASTHTGTLPYMSPEVFLAITEDVKYYPNTDVWSLGCVLYELFFLKYAFHNGQKGNPEIPSDISSCAIFSSILPKMLEKDLLVRITSRKLLVELLLLEEKYN